MRQQVQKVGNFSQDRVKQLRADLKVLSDKVKNQKADSDKDEMIAVRLIFGDGDSTTDPGPDCQCMCQAGLVLTTGGPADWRRVSGA